MTQQKSSDARDLQCFVIGPIGDREAEVGTPRRQTYEDSIEVFENIIEPACHAYGLAIVRADRITRTGEVTDQIFRHLRDSYLVVADVTGANPNVMYELGLRHSTGKPTIQLGERERLPFDIATIRTILFRRSEGGFIEARRQLSALIGAALAGGGSDPVAATRVWFESAIVSTSELVSVDADDEEMGYLEKLVAMAQGIDAASLNLELIAGIIREIAVLTNAASDQRPNGVSDADDIPATRLLIANTLAADTAEPASRLEVAVGDYRQTIQRMDPGVRYVLTHIGQRSDVSSATSVRLKIAETMLAVDENLPEIERYRRVLLETGEATRSLRRVFRRIIASLEQLLATRRIFDEWKALLQEEPNI